MRSRNLIILALVVVALGAYILLVEHRQPTTDERLETADRLFPDLVGDDVASVDLSTSLGTISLVRLDDEWRITEPLDYPADAAAVRSLVSSIEALDAERSLPVEEIELADYGLDEPSLAVTLVVDGGRRFALQVGDEMPLGSKRPVRREGADEIVMTSGAFVDRLDREIDQWRSREVVDIPSNSLASVEIASGEDRIRAVRSNERWHLTDPIADLADSDQMQSLISELAALRVREFLGADTDLAAVGLEPPEYRVMLVRSDGGNPVNLDFASPADDDSDGTIACRRNGEDLFRVPDTIMTRLAKAPVLWRSSAVWNFATWDVSTIAVTNPSEAITIEKVDGLWLSADGDEVDSGDVRRRVNALAELEARDFDLLRPPTEVIGSVTLTFDGDEDEELIYTFYAPLEEGGHSVVTVNARDNVMGVDAAVVESIVGALDLLAPEPGELIEESRVGSGIG